MSFIVPRSSNVGEPVEHPADSVDSSALTCPVRPVQQGSSLEAPPTVASNKLLSGSTMESPSPLVVTSLILGTSGPPPTVLATGVVTQASYVGAPPTSRVLEASLSTVTGDNVSSPCVDDKNNNRSSVTGTSSLVDSRSPTVGGLDGVCSAPPLSPHKATSGIKARVPAEVASAGVSVPLSNIGGLMNLASEPPFSNLNFQREVVNAPTVLDTELTSHCDVTKELVMRGGRPPRRLMLLPQSSEAERTWAQQLRGSAPPVAYPVTPAPPPSEGVPASPYLSRTILGTARDGRTSGPVAQPSEYSRISGPLLVALSDMCSGRPVTRLWRSLKARDISPIMTFGNNSAAGRLRAWDLAMVFRFGSCRTLRTGVHAVAAGIMVGVAEWRDEEMWVKLGRLLNCQSFPTSPPPLEVLESFLATTGGRRALKRLAELASERTLWENIGDVDTKSYSLSFNGLPDIRVHSPASALEGSEPSLEMIHLLAYKLDAALLYPRDSPLGTTEGVSLRVGDVIVAESHTTCTAVVSSFPQDSDSLMVRTIEGTFEFAPRGTPFCPAIFGRFSLHHALPAPVSSDAGASR